MNNGLSPVPHMLNQNTTPPVISQKIPVYRLTEPYFDRFDVLHPKGKFIKLKSEPNTTMEPMNELAEAEMRKYLAKLDDIQKKIAEKEGRAYRSQLERYEQQRAQKNFIDESEDTEEGAISTGEKVQILGAKKYVGEDEEMVTDVALIKMKRGRKAKNKDTEEKNDDLV